MESGRRKRKMGINEEQQLDDDDEEEEEEKVEKFFALIRSTKEMRDRLRNVAVPNGSLSKEQEHKACQWNPMFRPEDFMEDSVLRSKIKNDHVLVSDDAGPSSSKTQHETEKETKNDDDGHGGAPKLDLNLSLSL